MQTIDEAQDGLIEEFGYLPDWLDRYQQLIDLARTLPAPPEPHKGMPEPRVD